MNRLNNELEKFFNEYYKEHNQLINEIERWVNKTNRGLDNLGNEANAFERNFEAKFEKVNRWIENKHKMFED